MHHASDLDYIGVAEAARLIADRSLSPVELTQAKLDRIEQLDSQLNAFITVTAERAMEEARAAESEIVAGRHRGAMHGIPFGLKDVINTKGVLTTAHSRILIDNVSDHDAAVAQRLREAGGILVGKLATHEFAFGGPSFDLPWPPARNPWNPAHFTGGSSSGSAAAVAAGLLPATIGTDTGGSIRIPAALTGVVGLKPTMGLVSRYGVLPNSFTFDTCGPMTSSVEDCALLLQAIAGVDARDAASIERVVPDYRAALEGGIGGMRIGVLRHFWVEDPGTAPEAAAAMEAAVDVLRKLGAVVEEARMRPLQDYYDVKWIIAASELYSAHEHDLQRRLPDFGADFLTRALPACLFRSIDYIQAQRQHRRIVLEMDELYARFDALVTVGALGPAPRLDAYRMGASWEKANVTTPFSVAGGPTLAICTGFTATGLPLAMQIAGRPFDETTLLRIGHAYEQARGRLMRRPGLRAGDDTVKVIPPTPPSTPLDLDASTRTLVEMRIAESGLSLDEGQWARLSQAAPYALAMGHRLQGSPARHDQPANVFRFPRQT